MKGDLKSPLNPSLRKRGEHPHPFPPPSEGEDEGGGTDKTALAYGKRCKEECEVNKSFARHPISCLTGREEKRENCG